MIQGDTDLIATGMGTGGSSSIPCGGASLAGATRKLSGMLKEVAADALETAVSDLAWALFAQERIEHPASPPVSWDEAQRRRSRR